MNSLPYLVLGYALKSDSCKCGIQKKITHKVSKSPTCLSYAICNAICTPQSKSQQQNKIQYIGIELTRAVLKMSNYHILVLQLLQCFRSNYKHPAEDYRSICNKIEPCKNCEPGTLIMPHFCGYFGVSMANVLNQAPCFREQRGARILWLLQC